MRLKEMTFDDKLTYQKFYNDIGHPGMKCALTNLETTLCFNYQSLVVSLQIFNWEATNVGVFNATYKINETLGIIMAICHHYKFKHLSFFSDKKDRYKCIVTKVGGTHWQDNDVTRYLLTREQIGKLWERLGKPSILIDN